LSIAKNNSFLLVQPAFIDDSGANLSCGPNALAPIEVEILFLALFGQEKIVAESGK